MEVIGIDPGTNESALVWYDWPSRTVTGKCIDENAQVLAILADARQGMVSHVAIEMVQNYGKAVGSEVFDTCVWIGRFIEAWSGPFTLITRPKVNMHICLNRNAKDPWIRQALIDKFGPGKRQAIGLKKSPGPLYGFKTHLWAALAVCVTWAEVYCLAPTEEQQHGG